jgi:pimeloyl-ACP methyl ester carboxylesterase
VLLERLDATPALACGTGLGAVAALELLLRRPDLLSGAILIEPPLLAFLPEATEGIAADRQAIGEGVQGGGPEAGIELFLRGELPHLGPGAERIPPSIGAVVRERPLSLFAELGAVPAWSIRSAEMRDLRLPSRIVCGDSTPTLLRSAADRLGPRLGGSERVEVGADGLVQVTGASELADVVAELLEAEAATRA